MTSVGALQPLIAEALSWRLLAVLFERPREGWREELRALRDACDDDALRETAKAAIEEASEGSYLAALGPGGLAPAREAGYQIMRDTGRVLADLQAFYQAFAYCPKTEEPPDHVAVEIGFVGYLTLKEAYAMAEGREDDAGTTAAARAEFLQEHLAPIAASIGARLAAAGIAYLSRAAAVLSDRVPPVPERAIPPADPFANCAGCLFE